MKRVGASAAMAATAISRKFELSRLESWLGFESRLAGVELSVAGELRPNNGRDETGFRDSFRSVGVPICMADRLEGDPN